LCTRAFGSKKVGCGIGLKMFLKTCSKPLAWKCLLDRYDN
jgi:hypothetical protein